MGIGFKFSVAVDENERKRREEKRKRIEEQNRRLREENERAKAINSSVGRGTISS